MNKRDLWNRWADPSDWAEYGGSFDDLSKEEADFYKDLDKYFEVRQGEELEKAKKKIIEHVERLQKNEEAKKAEEKGWDMDPKELQQQVYKQLKNLKSIEL